MAKTKGSVLTLFCFHTAASNTRSVRIEKLSQVSKGEPANRVFCKKCCRRDCPDVVVSNIRKKHIKFRDRRVKSSGPGKTIPAKPNTGNANPAKAKHQHR